MPQSVAPCFQASDCFLERFFVSLTDTHDFTDGAHLGAQFIFHTFEFFKCPACEFDHDIIAVRYVFIQCAVFSARNVFQREAGCQHC